MSSSWDDLVPVYASLRMQHQPHCTPARAYSAEVGLSYWVNVAHRCRGPGAGTGDARRGRSSRGTQRTVTYVNGRSRSTRRTITVRVVANRIRRGTTLSRIASMRS
jgi:hypothetical protein